MGKYAFYTSNEIEPRGWMKRQLQIQAEGLSGNLDKIWPDVRDSAWIGGKCEGWERVPYWLDGFIPLAYLLKSEDMIARAKKYIDAILAGQKESGWICPCTEEQIPTYDTWAVQLISKVLVVYYDCSKDERIPDVLYRMMKNYYGLLSAGTITLFNWGKTRWYEAFVALNFLKERYCEPWIAELASILISQGQDPAPITDRWERPLNKWTFETHVVNLGMLLKSEAVTSDLLPGRLTGQAEEFYGKLMKYNGTPVGIFTGDECLSGLSPIQGTELCGVVELMYSFEHLFAATGNPVWLDRLELVGFNALPATVSEDMWAHQYVQMSNQIACCRFPGRSVFRTNGFDAHVFGLEPNYGCCTANFNQGFPKFALSSFFRDRDDVISAVPMPSALHADGIDITLDTEYPFKNELTYRIAAGKAFRLKVRVPSFAEAVTVNGKESEKTPFLVLPVEEGKETVYKIAFSAHPELIARPHGLFSVKYGSLIFSLPIAYETRRLEYTEKGVERKFPYCDYELLPTSEWRYGISSLRLCVKEHGVSPVPFSLSAPPVTVSVGVKRIDWEYEDGFDSVCAKIPADRHPIGEETVIDFVPYGAAKLRITELPVCEVENGI